MSTGSGRDTLDPSRASNGGIVYVPMRSVVSRYRYSAITDPLPRGSYVTCGTPDERKTSNGAIDGANTSGANRPGALTATLISTASHVETVSGACATMESWATTARIPITSLFRREVAQRGSVSA